jgi:hypothetical protein
VGVRIVDDDAFGEGLQDGGEALGTRGRLRLGGLRPAQRRLRLLAGILLGGVEPGAVDRQGDAVGCCRNIAATLRDEGV